MFFVACFTYKLHELHYLRWFKYKAAFTPTSFIYGEEDGKKAPE